MSEGFIGVSFVVLGIAQIIASVRLSGAKWENIRLSGLVLITILSIGGGGLLMAGVLTLLGEGLKCGV